MTSWESPPSMYREYVVFDFFKVPSSQKVLDQSTRTSFKAIWILFQNLPWRTLLHHRKNRISWSDEMLCQSFAFYSHSCLVALNRLYVEAHQNIQTLLIPSHSAQNSRNHIEAYGIAYAVLTPMLRRCPNSYHSAVASVCQSISLYLTAGLILQRYGPFSKLYGCQPTANEILATWRLAELNVLTVSQILLWC